MKRRILISSIILLSIQALAGAGDTYYVFPSSRDYPTIQSGIDAAAPANDDVVIVAPGVYTGPNNVDLDFQGKAITVKSEINLDNPEPSIIASTIIDCQGNKDEPHRAFYFYSGEGNDSKVLGFTIINGYGRGPKGADANTVYIGIPVSLFVPLPTWYEEDPTESSPYALNGDDASGNGYGGAIICAGASPTIQHCVISNCTVTGAHGGDGADGLSGEWDYWTIADFNLADGTLLPGAEMEEGSPDGQWGGSGGSGSGNGYGGAIACLAGSSPIINDCILSDNVARGGCGGDGGNGGNAAWPPDYAGGDESGGGNAGDSIGDGIGGAIYCNGASSPTITNCIFINNAATTGARGSGGQRGLGNELGGDFPRAPEGLDSWVFSTGGIAGGAAYYSYPSDANFINCTFTDNKAYEAYLYYNPYIPYLDEDISAYTVGGALYSDTSNIVNLDTCEFTGNLGGAVYCETDCTVNIHNTYDPNRKCLFTGNSDPCDGGDLMTDIGIDFGSGGAIYIDANCDVNIQNCIFGGNLAKNDGGALKCKSNATITNCSFGNNSANNGYGGAMDAYRPGTTLIVDFNNCGFTGNQAIYGGGFSSENFDANFINCYFIGNTALDGGGLDLVNGDIFVAGGVVKGNNATNGDGGGLNCRYTAIDINDCVIMDNSADGTYPSGGDGGAINFYGGASAQTVFNCLITGNKADVDGGAIFCHYASPEIGNCTFSNNLVADGNGGAVFSDFVSEPNIINCIFEGCNNHAIHEEDYGGNAIVRYSLFYNNPDNDYYESDTFTSYDFGGAPDPNGNFNDDPCFVSGDLGDYYLSQIAAGQGSDSPAINNGSETAVNLGLDTYTTRTDNADDTGQVDRGYHYLDSAEVETFQLTTSVTGGNGTVTPTSGTYYAGTLVTLTATPDTGWLVKAWSGTDDDSSTGTTNTVVMNSDRTVTIEFRQPNTFIVAVGGGEPGHYVNITDALHDAEDGDIIIVYPGVYYGPQVQVNKDVEIKSQHPDNPNWVEQVIIDSTGHAGPVFVFDSSRGPGCILNGLTIQNSTWYTDTGEPGDDPGENGEDGPGAEGGAIRISSGASPVIKNCLIRDNSILGGFGGNGASADDTHNAGRGGWGGWAYGGAIYCDVNSSPTFINCRIIDNQAVGGVGGNGGDWDPAGGRANYGGNWSRAEWWDRDPESLDWVWVQGDLWEVWLTTLSTDPYIVGPPYIGDYRWYSGYGGGVFINRGSNVTFIDCTISGNLVQGGLSGLGGFEPGSGPYRAKPFPLQYEIPSFGGGVYCAADSNVTFTGCTITDNVSSEPLFDHIAASEGYGEGDLDTWMQEGYDPLDTYSIDPYVGHGGGVCAEDTATVIFTDCNLSENKAAVGGGIHGGSANLRISNCEFISNYAYQGGGLFAEHGPADINSSNFTDNIASSDANDPNALGLGGAMHFWATDANIIDCNINHNRAEASGGGVYFGGEGTSLLTNCLLTKNIAGRDGGAVSSNIFSQLAISNCTIADNIGTEYGGGLSYSYGSYTDIINSIIWNNTGIHGSQIAAGTGFEYDPSFSTVDITYSDIQDPNTDDVPPLDIVFCIDTTASMADDINSVKASAVQIINQIVDTAPDYRIAVVDYRDFNEAPYGNPGDYEYNDVSVFTDNNQTAADAINSLTIGIGGDIEESVYSGLIHSIDGNSLGGWRADGVNRVIILMGDAAPHDPEPFTDYTLDDVIAAAETEPSKTIFSILIGYDEGAEAAAPYFRELAEETGGITLQAADANEVVDAVMTAISLIMPTAGFYAETGCTINGFDFNPITNRWDPNSDFNNINEDPNFIGGYLLSQIAAGQEFNSPCVDTGSDLASVFGLDTYTTRTDSIPDDANVDMGYHYDLFVPIQYQLVFMALDVPGLSEANQPKIDPNTDPNDPNYWSGDYLIFKTVELAVTSPPNGYDILWSGTDHDDSNQPTNTVTMVSNRTVTVTFIKSFYDLTIDVIGGNGRLSAEIDVNDVIWDPNTQLVKRNKLVNLTAVPDEGYRVKRWIGTDDDISTENYNTITMDSNETVTVEFEQPATISVPGDYSSIQQALDAAEEGDIILVSPGTYTTSTGYLIQNMNVTISGVAPDDPCVVAATVINMEIGEEGYVDKSAFRIYYVGPETVLNGITISGFVHQAYSGLDADELGEDGHNGDHAFGGGILCVLASPTIKNCIITDCSVIGGNGGNGFNGSGNDQNDPNIHGTAGGWPGRAYGGGLACLVNSNPTVINCTFENCSATGGNGGDGGDGSVSVDITAYGGRGGGWYYGENSRWYNEPWDFSSQGYYRRGPNENSFYDFYNEYTGRGGAVFVGEDCSPKFTHCTFTNNYTEGGTCGITGIDGFPPQDREEPSIHWEIENFGGAAFCEAGSSPTFTECTFIGNTADTNYPADNDDPYVSYGGAVAWETDVNVTFENCTFSDNLACLGGAMYGEWADSNVADCNFTANSAYHGGGIYVVGSSSRIVSSTFFENRTDSNGLVGEGGAIYCFDVNAFIADCQITNNSSDGSGGGIYISGRETTTLLKNCLITSNYARRDGGGISANWYAEPNIVNCTIANNTGVIYGGGLYCSYGSYTNVINSIIWGNVGINGSQVAVGTGFEYDERPSTVDISYSDVGVSPYAYSAPINPNESPVIRAGFDDYNLPANDDESTGLVNIGFTLNYFGMETFELYINNNGNVTFDANMVTFTPFGLTGNIGTPIIAPFFADVDTRAEDSNLVTYGTGTVDGRPAFGVNWLNVGYYDTYDDKLNSFQLILIDRSDRAPGDFDIEFNYETLNWETGDASGGIGGFGGESARAGFSSGTGEPGTFYEFEGSGEPGELLDSSATGLIYGSRKSSVLGRYIFAVQSGLPELLTSIPFYVDVNCVLNGFDPNNDTNSWDPNSIVGNISEDPNFILGYLLSQIAAGQEFNSPCVDTGSDLASVFGLDTYTTRTDSIPDDANVDMGYHYDLFVPIQYQLVFMALDVPGLPEANQPVIDPNTDPNDPNYWSGDYPIFKTVELAVTSPVPDGYDIFWSGTNNDDSNQPTNTVTMLSDKIVTVTFVKNLYDLTIDVIGGNGRLSAEVDVNDFIWDPNTYGIKHHTEVKLEAVPDEGYRVKAWGGTDDDTSTDPCNTVTMDSDKTVTVEFEQPAIITVPGDHTTIQAAIEAAREGDTIQVASGVYYGRARIIDKDITITSTNPDDPNVVAVTVISGEGYANVCVLFRSNAGSNAVLNGFTIANGSYFVIDAEDADEPGENGPDGGGAEGGGIYCEEGSSPTIKNCIIRDCNITGGNAGDAGNAADDTPAGRGGWGGWAKGAGIYIAPNASPTLINCTITNCYANGADGGNGGNSYGTIGEDYQDAGYGGLWSNPAIPGASWEDWGYVGDYRYYSGYGGGAYCDVNSSPTFIHCTITGNETHGGMSGIGGDRPWTIPDPVTAYEIPSYGGGVYCAKNSTVEFIDCNITNNTAPKFTIDEETGEAVYRIDPYLGHGGGIAFEETASVIFRNCNITDNLASVGGGVYFSDPCSPPEFLDCNFIGNLAYRGAGMFGTQGSMIISNCLVSNNFAGMTEDDVNDANDMPIAGQGGGIYSASMESQIIDSTIIDNEATTSGGGILFTGIEASSPTVTNCLVVDNQAGRDGGGLSINWHATPRITNCTIIGNKAIGDFGETETALGGGLSCSYGSYTNIINSIIWNNVGLNGSQVAVGTGFEYDPRPSTVDISYSNIQDPNTDEVSPLDLVFCIDTTGSMADDINSVKDSAVQIINHIASTAPDFRIAVVDYRDFNEAPYGNPNIDYEYNDVSVFTDNNQAAVDAIDSLTIGAGGDWEESVYSGLMHCIDGNSLGGWRTDGVNRVIILMGDAPPHDPEPFTDYTLDDVIAAATTEPSKTIFSILVGGDEAAAPSFEELAEETGGITLQAANAGEVVDAVMTAISLIMPTAGFYAGEGCTINGFDFNPVTNRWDPNSDVGNISEDPNFVLGYLLSQIAAGQEFNSPCVDTGSDLASVFGLDTYTTRTDSIPDDANVDMGYHYNLFVPIQYQLVFMALDVNGLPEANQPVIDPNIDPNDPNYWSSDYPIFTTVELAVTSPPDGYDILWSGTDHDDSNQPTNTVKMLSDKTVTVTFVKETYQLTVEAGPHGTVAPPWSPGTYTVKHHNVVALEAVPEEGYRVEEWIGADNISTDPCNTVTVDSDKTVRVEFELPDTLYVPAPYSSIQEALDNARDGDTVMLSPGVYHTSQGYQIDNKDIIIASTNPDDPCVVAATVIEMLLAPEGDHQAAFRFSNVGPGMVLNGLTISGFYRYGLDGLEGEGGGADGGNGVSLYGGAIYCMQDASPTIKNCVITDCWILGGNGANGNDGDDDNPDGGDGGEPGRAYGGGLACRNNSSPTVINCIFNNCEALGGNGGDGGNGNEDPDGNGGEPGGWNSNAYTGCGGAVYVGQDCSPTFTHCTFSNNRTEGGISGICGISYPLGLRNEPAINYKISNFGGAVFCDSNNSSTFDDCVFNNNLADTNYPGDNYTPYVSYGGAVAWKTDENVTFENCTFNNNLATVGGAMYCIDANTQITDCNISGNLAYLGGGMFGTNSFATIYNCLIQNNLAEVAPGDINDIDVPMPGQGGGLYSASMELQIIDCTIIGNEAIASGGGILFTGVEANTPTVTNCLVVDNIAGRDGGGLSINWHATPLITNCTLVGNEATGDFGGTGLGGGLYSGYQSYTVILNSILWDNYAPQGSEIAVGTGFEYDPWPSTVNVSYSDVKGGATGVFVDTGCTLEWDDANNLHGTSFDNPLFVGSYYLSEPDTGELHQTEPSPCIDAGLGEPNILCDGPYAYTTRTDNADDINEIDIGYHYRKTADFAQGDLNYDGVVDFNDWVIWQADYLNWCGFPCWCQGHDLNRDGIVNLEDEALLKKNYGKGDMEPPAPNPSTWDIPPYSTGPTTVSMLATRAYDNSGQPPYYYFECNDSNFDSGWQLEREYAPTGLAAGTEYGFRVRAKDQKCIDYQDANQVNGLAEPNGVCDCNDPEDPNAPNKTDWSHIGYVITGEDTTPPITDPCATNPYKSTWETPPYATGSDSIMMVVTQATDTSGVEYYFECTFGDGNDSGWQDSTEYENTGLDPCTTYGYHVRARDKADTPNYGYWSDEAWATTLGEEEEPNEPNEPPPPPAPTLLDAYYYYDGTYVHHAVVAQSTEADADYYRFVCNSEGVFSSQWVPRAGSGTVTYTHPVSPIYPDATVTYGVGTITYDVVVSTGSQPTWSWKVCSSDSAVGSGALCSSSMTVHP